MTVEPERLVLVLSGGGMKVMAEVGVLRALEEARLVPAEVTFLVENGSWRSLSPPCLPGCGSRSVGARTGEPKGHPRRGTDGYMVLVLWSEDPKRP